MWYAPIGSGNIGHYSIVWKTEEKINVRSIISDVFDSQKLWPVSYMKIIWLIYYMVGEVVIKNTRPSSIISKRFVLGLRVRWGLQLLNVLKTLPRCMCVCVIRVCVRNKELDAKRSVTLPTRLFNRHSSRPLSLLGRPGVTWMSETPRGGEVPCALSSKEQDGRYRPLATWALRFQRDQGTNSVEPQLAILPGNVLQDVRRADACQDISFPT